MNREYNTYNLQKEWISLITSRNIRWFISITFNKRTITPINELTILRDYTNRLNRYTFGKYYKKSCLNHTGFCVREVKTEKGYRGMKSGLNSHDIKGYERPHYHFLIEDNPSVKIEKRETFETIHNKSVVKTEYLNQNDFQVFYSKDVIEYCQKDFYLDRGDSIYFIGKDGLDNQMVDFNQVFKRKYLN